jgi:poly(A)-specific ribonuclease
MGLSLVIKQLFGKVLVGHNCFLDLMFIYSQFIDVLPQTHQVFIQKVHELFPQIYDTKLMAQSLLFGKRTNLHSLY